MADQMAYAQANSNTSVTQLGEAYQNCAANLHAAGQDMETVTSLLEAMANQGTKGHQAGTQLSAMMRDISQKMKNGSIQIGKTAVAVQDSEGNFRDLTDILRDVEAATEGMGTAEKTAALQKTFTAKSIRAVNQVLTEGVDKVAQYENELRNADGTAAAMAATMQDNLKGAKTEMGSAAEGLGIAIYEKFSGALTGLVDLGTSILSGLTDVLTPDTQPLDDYMDAIRKAQEEADGITISPTLSVMDMATDDPTGLQKYLDGIKESGDTISKMALDPDVSGLQDYIDEIKEAGDSLNATREAATEYMNASVNQAALVGALGDRLMTLNEIEEKSMTQRYEMRTLVQELSQFVPELASAYDEEAGSINMTTKEVEALIKAKQRQMIMDAQAATQQEVVNELYKAETELMKAEEARAAAWEAKKSARKQAKSWKA